MTKPFSIDYAEAKDVNYTIQILKSALNKLKMNESYALKDMEPSINRMLIQLEVMMQELQKDTATTEINE